jgi:hypothetical protein
MLTYQNLNMLSINLLTSFKFIIEFVEHKSTIGFKNEMSRRWVRNEFVPFFNFKTMVKI